MSFHRNSILFAAAMCCVSMFGQTVSSSLVGTVLDPANAVVPNAPVTLIEYVDEIHGSEKALA